MTALITATDLLGVIRVGIDDALTLYFSDADPEGYVEMQGVVQQSPGLEILHTAATCHHKGCCASPV